MKVKGYGKFAGRLISTGMILVMAVVSVCGCGTGGNTQMGDTKADGSGNTASDGDRQSADASGDGAGMGRYLEEVTDMSESYFRTVGRQTDDLGSDEPVSGVRGQWSDMDGGRK